MLSRSLTDYHDILLEIAEGFHAWAVTVLVQTAVITSEFCAVWRSFLYSLFFVERHVGILHTRPAPESTPDAYR
jgi:hypothetical protein